MKRTIAADSPGGDFIRAGTIKTAAIALSACPTDWRNMLTAGSVPETDAVLR
jgi:hypothetical protein